MPTLLRCWLQHRRAVKDSREAELCLRALRELTQIGREFELRDREAGRPPIADYAEELMRDMHIDRAQRR